MSKKLSPFEINPWIEKKSYTQEKAKELLKEEEGEKVLEFEQIIRVKTKEGDRIFNLESVREYWYEFYKDHNLGEIAESLPQKLQFSKERLKAMKEIIEKYRFDGVILLPASSYQYLQKIADQMTQSLESVKEANQQYQGLFLYPSVGRSFPDEVKNLDQSRAKSLDLDSRRHSRPKNKPYLLFFRKKQEALKDKRKESKTAPEIIKEEIEDQTKDLTFLNLPEYLIFQRNYVEEHKDEENPHPDTQFDTILASFIKDTVIEQGKAREEGSLVGAGWSSDDQDIKVESYSWADVDKSWAVRPAAIFEIKG